ncbi:hypothetical protein CQW23_07374 [Capsicum baccatum]|uniref:Protein kinase domain-containing protein n=1 Tax=Capsicum baccatum TaxID=33114 RepID=A0A2G2X5Y6_CAPBA|nr:hypothetical protein CQW23_07374 [Capsicum baccatum]
MEIPSSSILCSVFVIMLVLLLLNTSVAKPRSQTVKITCGTQLELNTTTFIPNFVGVMEIISQQTRTREVIGISMMNRYTLRYAHKTVPKASANDAEKLVEILHDINLNFKYSTLVKATGSFDEVNKLGKDGFSMVYKGGLADGREIAVKRLFYNNTHRAADFYNEVNIVSSVEHKNLIRLLGCSCSGPESLLVYEFLPNQSLDRFIFDQSGAIMDYLRFIYREFMAPEYLAHGQLMEKIDVYTFRVLLLKIVTGRQSNQRNNIAWEHFQRRTVKEIFNPNLMLQNSHTINMKNEVTKVLHVGLLCTQEIPTLRPSMSKVLHMFVKKEEELPSPTTMPFMDEKTMELHDPWEKYSFKRGGSTSIAMLSHTYFYPR